ncbi:uncharacterized protein LOC143258921 [Megalopta genalis]|uniref:uncharacterized protein LOC143258921 n=1 Tax=Megalopta genalis TaxID=115081 RepID=UPI003FD212B7
MAQRGKGYTTSDGKDNGRREFRSSRRCGKDRVWPIIYTNFLLRCLIDSVAICVRDSPRIISITIDGIPLSSKYLDILCTGLRNNQRLSYLSLKKCRIGDVGCNMLLESLANNPNLRLLNLSGCRLTSESGVSLYLFLKRRRADLLQNVWTETSDRSRECSPVRKALGFRTLILNHNPKFGENGVRQLMYAVKFDCWLKSLSLKRCGVTKQGAEDIINVLKFNNVLTRVNLTGNRISINTFKVLWKLLNKRRESTESKLSKKRFFVNWKKTSLRSVSNNEEQSTFKTGRCHRNLSRICLQRRFPRIQERPKQLKEMKNMKKESALKMKKKDLRVLECQLLDIIDSNRKLMKELTNNKALVDTELQERSKTETEMQKVSLQLYDLRSKVIMVNCLRSQLSYEHQILQKSFRYIFEKLGSLTTQKRSEIEIMETGDM